MSLPLAERVVAPGDQLPRLESVPPYVSTSGDEAIELAEMCGLVLDPWQQHVLRHSMGERADGRWAAREVGLVVARQNGKGGILEARELAGLFLLPDEWLIIHSAHLYDTAMEAFRRLTFWITETPELSKRVKRIVRSHGEEGIELVNGKRIRFRTRTNGGGRGLTGDLVILDEAMDLPIATHGSLMPTLSAVPNPQLWYTGSAVDEEVHAHGLVFTKVRDRGVGGQDPALAFFEWSPAVTLEELMSNPDLARDQRLWGNGNPALNIRIDPDFVASEQEAMFPRTFAVERLSVGAWPTIEGLEDTFIPKAAWAECGDPESVIAGPVTFGVDVSPLRDWTSVFSAGARADGAPHVEIVARQKGTEWVVNRCVALKERHGGVFVIDPKGQAGQLIPDLKEEGLTVHELSTAEYVAACGEFYDSILLANHDNPKERAKRLRYRDVGGVLTAAVGAAATRTVGEAWAWSRRSATSDITALVAATVALWGAEHLKTDSGMLAASMLDYLKRNGMADPKDRDTRLKELIEKRQAKVDAILKKARGDE